MSREEQQELVLGSQPWVYMAEEEILNGNNGDVPPQPVLLVVEELETDLA